MFLDCPAWLDSHGAVRRGLPAEARRRFIPHSTGGYLKRHDQVPAAECLPTSN
jgi:hypothetical protein